MYKSCDLLPGSELCVFQVKDFATCVKWYPLDSNLFIAGSSDLMVAWDIRSPANPVRYFKYKDKFGQVFIVTAGFCWTKTLSG
jgi:hypothetical protein